MQVADHSKTVLHDYTTFSAIMAGLSNTSVYRLKKTWARQSPRKMQLFQDLEAFYEPKAFEKNMYVCIYLS